MRKTVFALAMLAAGLPAAASADTSSPVERFSHEGVTYSYVVTPTSYGQLIEGTADTRSFALKVRQSKVTGTFNGQPVSFKLSEVPAVVGIVEVALR